MADHISCTTSSLKRFFNIPDSMFAFSHFSLSPLISFVGLFSTTLLVHFSFSRLSSLLILCSYKAISSSPVISDTYNNDSLIYLPTPDLPSELYTHIYLIATWKMLNWIPRPPLIFPHLYHFKRVMSFTNCCGELYHLLFILNYLT